MPTLLICLMLLKFKIKTFLNVSHKYDTRSFDMQNPLVQATKHLDKLPS